MKNLITILKAHLACASKDRKRLNIQCTRFEFSDGCVKLISTDGHLLLISNITKLEYIEYLKEIFVNAKDVNILYIYNNIMKIIISLLIKDIKYILQSNEIEVSDFISFPDYKKVLPEFPVYDDIKEVVDICQAGKRFLPGFLSCIEDLEKVIKDVEVIKKTDGIKFFKEHVTYEATTKEYSFYLLTIALKK